MSSVLVDGRWRVDVVPALSPGGPVAVLYEGLRLGRACRVDGGFLAEVFPQLCGEAAVPVAGGPWSGVQGAVWAVTRSFAPEACGDVTLGDGGGLLVSAFVPGDGGESWWQTVSVESGDTPWEVRGHRWWVRLGGGDGPVLGTVAALPGPGGLFAVTDCSLAQAVGGLRRQLGTALGFYDAVCALVAHTRSRALAAVAGGEVA